jgi:ubiquinone/menaquinone biosynthesis C-methylase UbiE
MNLIDEPGWDSFARTYASDRFRKQSAAMGTPLTELLVSEAGVRHDLQILDIACGTGEPAISLANKLKGSGLVIATDVSPNPLGIAEQRARQRALGNIRFQVADAHSLPFHDEHFDLVTCRLGLMFMSDLQKVLREIRRVLKPGGRFVTVCWGPIRQAYFETTVGTMLEAFPELQFPDTGKVMFKFCEPGTLTRAFKEAGFSEAHDEIRDVEWTWNGTAQEVWEYFQAVTIPFAPLFSSLPSDKKPDVNQRVVEAISSYIKGNQVCFGGKFILATATR